MEEARQLLNRDDGRRSARDLARAIGYARFTNFEPCVRNAQEAITELQGDVSAGEHVCPVQQHYDTGIGARPVRDYRLTRYGAYMALGYSHKPELKHSYQDRKQSHD